MKLNKASVIAKNLSLESTLPIEVRLNTAIAFITLDRLLVVERLREISAELVNSGRPANPLNVAEQLEKEIREAQR